MITSGLPFFDILLTLQGILNYTFNLVLKTRLEAANSTPVSSAFFSSIDFLWPGVRLIKDLRNQGICQPSSSGFEHLATLSKRVINQNILEGGHHG